MTDIDSELPPALIELKPNSFINEIGDALSADTCSDMVQRFESRPDEHYLGRIGQTAQHDKSIKRSTDLRISGRPN